MLERRLQHVNVVADKVKSTTFEVHKGECDPIVIGSDILNVESETHLL